MVTHADYYDHYYNYYPHDYYTRRGAGMNIQLYRLQKPIKFSGLQQKQEETYKGRVTGRLLGGGAVDGQVAYIKPWNYIETTSNIYY